MVKVNLEREAMVVEQQQAKPSLSDNSSPTPSIDDEEDNNNNKKKDHEDEKAKQSMDQFEQNDKDPSTVTQAGEIESTKANLGEMMEENQRLKQYLDRIMKDYQALQMKFYEIAKQDSKKPKENKVLETPLPQARMDEDDEVEELVSLSLGRTLSVDSKKSIDKLSININLSNKEKDEVVSGSKSNCNFEEMKEKTLALGLNCNFDVPRTTSIDQGQTIMPTLSPNNSFDETKNGAANDKETWTPNTMQNNNNTRSGGDDEVAQQAPVKKARVSVRARCDTPTINDGCQWRKYGQKIAKGNPCPRAYYRCTVAPSCPVRKQVQRCAEDMSILITTYEGTHNHPLPISATAMASTTSAAAYMLTSGSSSTSSQSQGSHSNYTPTTSTITSVGTELHGGLSFNVPNVSNPKQLYLPNSSSTFSTIIPTNPTITLDLTTTNSSSASQFNRTSSFVPRTYPSSNLSFNSSNHSSSNTTNLLTTWPNGLLNYGHQPYTKQVTSSIDYVGSSRHLIHQDNNTINNNNAFTLQTILSKNNNIINNSVNQQPLPNTITQAAKVLTSDPSFQSVITAALSSFISSSSSSNNNNVNGRVVENSSHNGGLSNNKWGTTGSQSSSSSNSTLQSTIMGTNGCGSSLLSMTSSTMNSQSSGSLMFLSPSLSFFESKSTSTSPGDNRDHTN